MFTFIEEIFKGKHYFLYSEVDAFFKAFIETLIFILTKYPLHQIKSNASDTWISQKKRNEIAAKLQQGVSKEIILDDIRNNVGTEFLTDHIIDKQDMINIQRAYGLEEVQRHANDQTSVLDWI